jgi:hypothetical protein
MREPNVASGACFWVRVPYSRVPYRRVPTYTTAPMAPLGTRSRRLTTVPSYACLISNRHSFLPCEKSGLFISMALFDKYPKHIIRHFHVRNPSLLRPIFRYGRICLISNRHPFLPAMVKALTSHAISTALFGKYISHRSGYFLVSSRFIGLYILDTNRN